MADSGNAGLSPAVMARFQAMNQGKQPYDEQWAETMANRFPYEYSLSLSLGLHFGNTDRPLLATVWLEKAEISLKQRMETKHSTSEYDKLRDELGKIQTDLQDAKARAVSEAG